MLGLVHFCADKERYDGWWYDNGDGAYPKSCWMEIDGKWHYLNASGAMATGTQRIGGKTYRFNSSDVWVS